MAKACDYQRQRVYNWEHAVVDPRDTSRVHIDQAQAIVDHVWSSLGLQYAPKVRPIHTNTTRWAGQANRLHIALQPVVSTRTILHEIAHSLTSNVYGKSTAHGPWFVGMYLKLLDQFGGMPLPQMMFSCKQHGVEFDINAHPVFLDA